MPTQDNAPADTVPTEYLARTLAAVFLAGVAVIHLVDLPDTLQETPLIGESYYFLIAAAILGAGLLISVRNRLVWAFAALTAAAAIVGYVFSRTTGLPTDRVDLGNWNCALGIAALATEGFIVLLAGWRLQPTRALARAFDHHAQLAVNG
jgi:hypothetical protein